MSCLCLWLSSIPPLDLVDHVIVLAAEVVAMLYLDEEAHSAFWLMLLLTIMPALYAMRGTVLPLTPHRSSFSIRSASAALAERIEKLLR